MCRDTPPRPSCCSEVPHVALRPPPPPSPPPAAVGSDRGSGGGGGCRQWQGRADGAAAAGRRAWGQAHARPGGAGQGVWVWVGRQVMGELEEVCGCGQAGRSWGSWARCVGTLVFLDDVLVNCTCCLGEVSPPRSTCVFPLLSTPLLHYVCWPATP